MGLSAFFIGTQRGFILQDKSDMHSQLHPDSKEASNEHQLSLQLNIKSDDLMNETH